MGSILLGKDVSIVRKNRLAPRRKTVPSSLVSAEMALVCASVCWPLGEGERAAVERWSDRVGDWALVRKLIVRHRVAGLVSHALLTTNVTLPEDMRVWCASQKDAVGLKELGAAAEARRLTQILAKEGIASRVLKGPAVSIAAFGRLGLRTNRDLDILVDVSDRAVASRIISDQGYDRVEPELMVSATAFADWLHNHKDFVFARSDGMLVELHWRLFNNRALLPTLHRCASHRVTSAPFTFDTLPPTENILYLCVHGAEHAWSRLKWLADVAALLRQMKGEAITELLAVARRENVYPAVAQAVLLCARHLGLVLPSGMRGRLEKNVRVRILVSIAERSLFAGNGQELEEQRFGSTLKNLGHYLMASGAHFRREELRFDLMDLPAAGLSDNFRRFGPFARLVMLVTRHRLDKMQR